MRAIRTNCLICLKFFWFFHFADIQVSAIFGGTKVKITDAPFVALFITDIHGHTVDCGAAIIHVKMLLSAAHCNEEKGNQFIIVGTDFYKPSKSIPLRGQHYDIKEVIDHPGYKGGDDIKDDLCVIVLKSKLRFTNQVKPIIMGGQSSPPEKDDLLTLYGFGDTETGSTSNSYDLRKVAATFVAKGYCNKLWKKVISRNTICAGGERGKGACNGDSGSPVVFKDRLIGIMAAGPSPCGDGTKPNLISHVPSLRFFINNIIKDNPDTQCAFRPLGGTPVEITDAPFVASFKLENKRYTCAATIVHKKFLVATAHCLQEVAFLKSELTIIVASSEPAKNDGRKYQVEKIFIHPKFDDSNYDFDLSVIKLRHKLRLTDHVKTIELADSIKPIPGTPVTVYGFAETAVNNAFSESLHKLALPYYEWRDCHYLYSLNTNSSVTHRMFCAGEENKENACAGDNGGPVIYNNFLFGITSWGQDSCTRRYPSVFTYLFPLKSYIEEIIKNNS